MAQRQIWSLRLTIGAIWLAGKEMHAASEEIPANPSEPNQATVPFFLGVLLFDINVCWL